MKKSFKKLMAVVLSILLMASSIGVFASEESTAPTIADYQAISDPVQVTAPTYFPNELWSPYSNAGSVADTWGVIYRVNFPDMTGKEFNNFIFRFGTQSRSGNSFRVMGVPSSYDIPNMSPDVEPFVSMLANEGAYISNVGDILADETNAPYYINYADITAYANECLRAGDTYMYLFVNCSSTCKVFSSSLTDSTYIGLDLYPYYYYDTNKLPVYDPENPTIEGYQTISKPVAITGPTYMSGDVWTPFANRTTFNNGWGVIYKVDFPDMTGKEFENFIFRFATQTRSGNQINIMGIPASYDIPNMAPGVEPFASMLANESAYISNVGDILVDDTNNPWFINYADLTSYANKCLDAGDKYMYLLVNSYSSGYAFSSSLTDGTYKGLDFYPYYYCRAKEKDYIISPLIIADSNASDYDSAVSVTAPDKTSSYKAGAKFTNNTDSDLYVRMFIAKYDTEGEELLYVGVAEDAVPAKTEDYTLFTSAISQKGEDGIFKVFLWDAEYSPLTDGLIFESK